MGRHFVLLLAFAACLPACPQSDNTFGKEGRGLSDGLEYKVEMQSSFSKGVTPLWLNANRHGLSSLDDANGYLRAAVSRPLAVDSARRWGISYGADVVVPYNYTSDFVIQQAFFDVRWLNGVLSFGSKEYPMQFKNNSLSSGSQTLGINARPIPQVRLSLPEYYTLPFANGWLHLKGHVAYGWMTDDGWQHDFTDRNSKYGDNVLFHSKAGYLKIGKDDGRHPLSVEMGIEMATTFGGTLHVPDNNGDLVEIKNGGGFKSYWNAFLGGGSDEGETVYKNVEGNQLGSWLLRVNWDAEDWCASVYADKFFEDHSGMFLLDYDGYGSGSKWDDRVDNRYLRYKLKDVMLGAELNLKRGTWVRDVVVEYLFSKYQSGPIYHDHTNTISDHIGGRDNFYNHGTYTGWQHWGQVIGNPLYRSPIYNDDGTIGVKDNRFMAFHFGMSGRPARRLSYRLLASWQEGLGTYDDPYDKVEHNFSFLVECGYSFGGKRSEGWSLKGGYGMDFGKILGNNYGFQLTVAKCGFFNF